MGECAQGAFARMAVKAGSGGLDYSSGAHRLAFFREGLRTRNQIIHPDVITGDRWEHAERARKAPNLHYGPILLPISPGDLVVLLPAILGGTFSGINIEPAATISPYGYLLHKNPNLNPHEFQSAYVDKARFYGRQHGPNGPPNWLILELWLMAKAKSTAGTWPPALTLTTTAGFTPFVFEDSTLAFTLNGAVRETSEVMIEIDNHLEPRYVNALDPTQVCPAKATFRLITKHPYDSDHDDLENQALAGAAGTIKFTNGTISTQFNFTNLKAPDDTPVVRGKTETEITLEHRSYASGTTPPLSIDNDSTP